MTPVAFQRALRAFSQRSPFVPYEIQFMTGESIVVSHPEAVVVQDNVVVCRQANRRQRLFDSTSVCQLLEPAPQSPS